MKPTVKSPHAKALAHPLFRQRKVVSKKLYRRKANKAQSSLKSEVE